MFEEHTHFKAAITGLTGETDLDTAKMSGASINFDDLGSASAPVVSGGLVLRAGRFLWRISTTVQSKPVLSSVRIHFPN